MEKYIKRQIEDAMTSNSLYLDDAKITDEIWNEIVKLIHLEDLSIFDSEIGIVPQTISNLVNLKSLKIVNCKFEEFPISFTLLSNLEYLDIPYNEICELPSEFQNLNNLKNLGISHNPIKKFPEIIASLNNLEELNLSKTQISDYSGLEKLTNLKVLNLTDCELNSLPNEISKLINLQNISLIQNKLTNFPEQLLNLKNLESVDLFSNNIKEFPKDISNLKALKYITLINNKLTEIPNGISYIENLEHLILSNNQITGISTEVFKLKNLRSLILENNKITNIPVEIFELTKLSNIVIKKNPIDALKFGYVCSDKIKDILNFSNLKLEIFKISNYFFLKDNDNHCFIELLYPIEKLELRRDFYERFPEGDGFLINVFGNPETRKEFLAKIRNHFDNWLSEYNNKLDNRKSENNEKLVSRFFYYPISENFEKEIIINYDILLKLKELKEYNYIDIQNSIKIPIKVLLKYIDEPQNLKSENIEKNYIWEGENFITTIKLKNFKIFENIELNLNPQINILLGYNGIGKTSILQAITLGLLSVESKNEEKPEGYSKFIKVGSEWAELYIYYGEKDYRKLQVEESGLQELKPVHKPDSILLSYGVNLNADNKVDYIFLDNISSGNGDFYSTKSIFRDYSNDFNNPLTILNKLNEEIRLNPINEQIVSFIFQKINEYLSVITEKEKITLVFENGFYYFTDFNNSRLKLEYLSEGYKDHVLLISDIFLRIIACRNKIFSNEKFNFENFSKVHGNILIDEFDRHLHPSWQRKLLSKLKEDFPNIQFILTTHNPMSILDREGNEIIELKTDETGNITPRTHLEGTKYLDISQIYLKYFVKNIVSKELHDDIERYNELLISGKTNSDEFKQLEKKLKNAHVGYEINDLRYWKFLDFLKLFPEKDPTKNNEAVGDWDFSEEEWNDLLNEIK